jgi:hypothetical protein
MRKTDVENIKLSFIFGGGEWRYKSIFQLTVKIWIVKTLREYCFIRMKKNYPIKRIQEVYIDQERILSFSNLFVGWFQVH